MVRAMAKDPGSLETSVDAGVARKKHLGRCGGQRKAFQEGIKISSKELLCELGVVLK